MPAKNPWQHETIQLNNKGLDVLHPIEQVDAEHYSRMEDVKSLQEGTLTPRPGTSLLNAVVFGAPTAPVITATHIDAHGNGTNSTSYSSSNTITFEANRLYLCLITGRSVGPSGAISSATVVAGGMTWVKIREVQFASAASPNNVIAVWRGMRTSGSNNSTVAYTYDVASDLGQMHMTEFEGMDLTGSEGAGAIVQDVGNTNDAGTTVTGTLSAFSDVQNATYGAFGSNFGDGSWTEGTGFTQLFDSSGPGGPPQSYSVQWRNDNDTTVDATEGTSSALGVIAIEIKAP